MVTGLPALQFVRELDFKIVKEEWSIIKLADGSIIKFKPVLLRVFETDAKDPITGEPVYSVESQNIAVVKSPKELRGRPSEHVPPLPEALKMPHEEVEVLEVSDPHWNTYELETGKRIRTKAVITNVYRIEGVFDRYGNPCYVVLSQMVVGRSRLSLEEPKRTVQSFGEIYSSLPRFELSSAPRYLLIPNWSSQERLLSWTMPPITLHEDKLVIDLKTMEVGRPYQVEYKGRVRIFVKVREGVIDVYEVIEG